MNRLPIRIRLTLAFALAMAIVLALTGALLVLRLGSSLDEAIDEGLKARLADVSALAVRPDPGLRGSNSGALVDPEEIFAQVLDRRGRVVDAMPRAGAEPVLALGELSGLEPGGVLRLERSILRVDGGARLFATAIETPSGRRSVVVGTSLGDRDEAVQGLLRQLLLAGPAALLLASLLGLGLATAALRPVEAIRAEAAAISGAEPGRRLPLPAARDELARLVETLNGMLERLERALERERSFVADASHELRTPLAVLQTELELALRRPRSAAELEQALRSAAAETHRLTQLAEALLLLARSDGGRIPLHRTPVTAGDILLRVADRFRGAATAAGRALRVEAPAGVELTADASRLEQAVGNLVANTLQHGRGTIQLGELERDGCVELHVLDDGPGFPPEFLPHAFERFRRADQARSDGGAGLGLPIAAMIAEAHGGSAGAANRPSGGADVWLSIPTD